MGGHNTRIMLAFGDDIRVYFVVTKTYTGGLGARVSLLISTPDSCGQILK